MEWARPFGDSPTSLRPSRPVYSARPIYAAWLFYSVDGEAVRRVMRLAFAHTCPYQMPMRGATATITNVNATACRIVSSPCVTSAVWGRVRTVRTKKCVGLHPSSSPHTTCIIVRESPPHHPTFDFSANAAVLPRDAFVSSPTRQSPWPAHSHDPMRENGGGAVLLPAAASTGCSVRRRQSGSGGNQGEAAIELRMRKQT